MKYFETIFLEEAVSFIAGLNHKTRMKVLYHIDLAEQTNDARLFKKLTDDIWEFRTRHSSFQVRLLAFWDKRNKERTLVVATHGFMKKVDKAPRNEILRAEQWMRRYLNQE